jgi:proteasome lid subunit RPN8/RPN11
MPLIGSALRREIEAQGEAGYPREVCGFLIGRFHGQAREVERIRPVRNAWDDAPGAREAILAGRGEGGPTRAEWESASEERRFLIDPRDFAAADREARAAGLEIVGFYHSHPDHPAVPSRFDRDMAMPEQSYVIVSIRQGRAAELRSWVVPDFDGPFEEEAISDSAG